VAKSLKQTEQIPAEDNEVINTAVPCRRWGCRNERTKFNEVLSGYQPREVSV